MRLIYYNALTVVHERNHHLPGIKRFSSYFDIYNYGVVPVDRTGTIRFPVKTHSLFPMPAYRHFAKSYEEICNERARELLQRAERLDVSLYTFWSGGIDSTLVLTSLLKNATDAQKERIVVLMSEDSITENPHFYRDHIQGRLARESSMLFPELMGSRHLFVNGEHNDQLFGSDIVASVIALFGAEIIHKPYDRALFLEFLAKKTNDARVAEHFRLLFERLKDAAPVAIKTNYDMFWWINFAVKWQTVYTRTLANVSKRNASKITQEYLREHYAPFYNTEAFQLWSMNNPDKKIRDEWRSYKWPAKEIIYDFTKDAEYRDNKIKRGSLYYLIIQLVPFDFIDESLHFYRELDAEAYVEPENDFI